MMHTQPAASNHLYLVSPPTNWAMERIIITEEESEIQAEEEGDIERSGNKPWKGWLMMTPAQRAAISMLVWKQTAERHR